MDFLPIFLEVAGKRIVVDGGNTVAARRVERALNAGAFVTVFDPEPGDEVRAFFEHENLTHIARLPYDADFAECIIAYGASEVPERDALLHRAAKAAGALVNVADEKTYCDFITPSVVEREPITIAISTGGAAPVIARILRARMEAMLPAAYGRLALFLARFRGRIYEAVPNGRNRRRFWENLIEGPVGDAFLAGEEALAEERLEEDLARGSADLKHGEVWLVGAGPGDPDLLTFKALRMMQHADVVLYDRLVGDGIIDLVRRDAERIYVGKKPREHTLTQREITELMIERASRGERVLRLKGGDPFIFGRGGEELEDVAAHGIPVEVVPGITAAAGCGAAAGIPLTHRDHAQSCVFITAHGAGGVLDHDWTRYARKGQTVLVYMGLNALGEVAQKALSQGVDPDMPVAVIDNGTRLDQRVIIGRLDEIEAKVVEADLPGPALIVIGHVVSLYGKLGVKGSRSEYEMELKAGHTL
ncbi:siroheme synthase CysG [Maritimibacter dapengensis]|uniref:precorrin-2 dehydrogenase n=1 Tax=Maritimibacter dapengensis TaxID=2836868 RepID=A0ABS6T4D1_9RHOB|nr:siroheme synthase CysG [Maritimibacter dapengensis]MBV7380110.1 siroheme synthase CysG [Maritimibacter dapengensis]